MKRSAFLVTWILFFAMLFSSCKNDLRNDLSCRELCEEAISSVNGDFSVMGNEQLLIIFGDEAPYEDYAIFASTPTDNIDEIGIFKGKDKSDTERLTEILKNYVSETADGMRSFVMSYAPDEAKKLDMAEAFSIGNYAVYVILDKKDCEAVKKKIEERLFSQNPF